MTNTDRKLTNAIEFIDKAIDELDDAISRELPQARALTVEFETNLLSVRNKILRFQDIRKEFLFLENRQ